MIIATLQTIIGRYLECNYCFGRERKKGKKKLQKIKNKRKKERRILTVKFAAIDFSKRFYMEI